MEESEKPLKPSKKVDAPDKKKADATDRKKRPSSGEGSKAEAKGSEAKGSEAKSSKKTETKSGRKLEKAQKSAPPVIDRGLRSGAPEIKSPVPARPAVHACPRCQVTLSPDRYEGVAVERCDTCWGYWLGRLELETILTSKDEHFSRDEKKVAGRAPAHEGDRRMLTCVRCGKTMSKLAVEDDGMVAFLVDYCRDHGLWLDTGEIKRAQILDEKSGSVRKALRASFDRAALEADED